MAYLKMGEIHSTLHKAIKYAVNPEKTDQGNVVSSNFMTNPSDYMTAAKHMEVSLHATKETKTVGNVLAYHVIQSFAPGETTPEQCHRLGEQLAQKITNGGQCKYIVSTHLDRDHLHNHIIICAANDETHRKMRVKPGRQNGTLKQWRAINDELCREHNLSVITPSPMPDRVESLSDIYLNVKGISAKETMRRRVELAISKSANYEQFTQVLHDNYGVSVHMRGSRLTFQSDETGFKIRDNKLGQAFSPLNLMARINQKIMQEITFNKTLIASSDAASITVWIPKSHRQEKLTIPRDYVIGDGKTYRAFLTANQKQVITDRAGQYKKEVRPEELYQYFAPPDIDLRFLADQELVVNQGRTDAQQRYYQHQASELQEIQERIRYEATMMRIEGDSIGDKIATLQRQIQQARAELQAVLIASSELPADMPLEERATIERREKTIRELAAQIITLKDHQKQEDHDRNSEQTERQHKKNRTR